MGPSRRAAQRARAQTVLAWRRTAMQVFLVALAATRLLIDAWGWWLLAAALVGAAVVAGVQVSVTRYLDAVDTEGPVRVRPDPYRAALPHQALVAGSTGAMGVGALVWVVLQA